MGARCPWQQGKSTEQVELSCHLFSQAAYRFCHKVQEKKPHPGTSRLSARRLRQDPAGLAMHTSGIRRGRGSRASFGGDPSGTQHLHPDQQPENGECPTGPQSFFRTSEAAFLASGPLRGKCWRSPLWKRSGVTWKARERLKKREDAKQDRPLDPLLPCGRRRGMRGQEFRRPYDRKDSVGPPGSGKEGPDSGNGCGERSHRSPKTDPAGIQRPPDPCLKIPSDDSPHSSTTTRRLTAYEGKQALFFRYIFSCWLGMTSRPFSLFMMRESSRSLAPLRGFLGSLILKPKVVRSPPIKAWRQRFCFSEVRRRDGKMIQSHRGPRPFDVRDPAGGAFPDIRLSGRNGQALFPLKEREAGNLRRPFLEMWGTCSGFPPGKAEGEE